MSEKEELLQQEALRLKTEIKNLETPLSWSGKEPSDRTRNYIVKGFPVAIPFFGGIKAMYLLDSLELLWRLNQSVSSWWLRTTRTGFPGYRHDFPCENFGVTEKVTVTTGEDFTFDFYKVNVTCYAIVKLRKNVDPNNKKHDVGEVKSIAMIVDVGEIMNRMLMGSEGWNHNHYLHPNLPLEQVK